MEIELIIKIIGIGLIVCVAHQILSKNGHDEQGIFVTVAGIVTIMLILLEKISSLIDTIERLFGL